MLTASAVDQHHHLLPTIPPTMPYSNADGMNVIFIILFIIEVMVMAMGIRGVHKGVIRGYIPISNIIRPAPVTLKL